MLYTVKTVDLTGKQCMVIVTCIKNELYDLGKEIERLSEKRTEAEMEGQDGSAEILTSQSRSYERTRETLRTAMKKLIW